MNKSRTVVNAGMVLAVVGLTALMVLADIAMRAGAWSLLPGVILSVICPYLAFTLMMVYTPAEGDKLERQKRLMKWVVLVLALAPALPAVIQETSLAYRLGVLLGIGLVSTALSRSLNRSLPTLPGDERFTWTVEALRMGLAGLILGLGTMVYVTIPMMTIQFIP